MIESEKLNAELFRMHWLNTRLASGSEKFFKPGMTEAPDHL